MVQCSIIIPTLNEAHSIRSTLDRVRRVRSSLEVIVVDGGSSDRTIEIAREHGVRVLHATRGRGSQMHAGACAARGDVFWFLHADTIPPADATEQITRALSDPRVVAGNFAVRFDGEGRAANFLTWLYPHLRKLGLCYGDSGIFVRRDMYERVGGFREFPIFEDLDLMRRLRPYGRITHIPVAVVTSSRRFERRSFAFTFMRWMTLQILYWLGVHPRTLGRLYAPIRSSHIES